MALTRKFGGLSTQLLKNRVCLFAMVRCFSDKPLPWNYLWSPGEYKKQDHDKIAEKYHLHPKDYQPYPESENKFLGDYPKLPLVGPAAKDPYYPYDIPEFRKNYHETVHDQFEVMGEDRYSYGFKYRIDPVLGTVVFFTFMITVGIITYLLEPYPSFSPRLERQFPQEGVVHYTFEPANSRK
ncbi:NADH dehydrogenase [ubiquinone] 1 beta subcomplex subunit 8, mitochondrial [Solenopsis invicta]|uniref:NADH dehydrogenase [ubiquinone] 1 beta subcomplex subunit 8, mitochondrial n=1 Tax=Solenopsis invicta TaxID=13686 RepID=UPI000595F4CD|nr:NADH dehydrogenase [ubiquinone] 1 beta subcomplex subunit 8, mitochondrial [Solenopsis invicta]